MDKRLEMYLEIYEGAKDFLKRHWYDEDMGEVDKKGSVANELTDIDTKYDGSMLWKLLILDTIDCLEAWYKYRRKKEIN